MQSDWLAEFKELCQETIRLTVEDRMRYGFIYEYKPILDDAPWRSFESMAEYRHWCDLNLPKYLGYGTDKLDPDTLDRLSALNARREIARRKRLRSQRE